MKIEFSHYTQHKCYVGDLMSAPEKDNVASRHSRHGKQTLLDLTHSQTDISVKNRVVTDPFGILWKGQDFATVL